MDKKNKNKILILVENSPTSLRNIESKDTIDSYAQLVKALSDLEIKNSETLLDTVTKVGLVESDDTNYNNLPLKVMYKQIPAVINGELLVKIVVLQQGDKLAIVVPENVSKIYEDIKEVDNKEISKTMLSDFNINLALYAEVYGFSTDSSKFADIIKTTYLSTGNFTKAFELVGEDIVEEEKEEEDSFGSELPSSDDFGGDSDDFDFGDMEMDTPAEDFEEITENAKAYKKFTNVSKSLNTLANKIKVEATEVLKANTKFKYLNKDKTVLVVEVDNKKIYNAFPKSKNIAKQTISKLGENIRKNRDTQLLDSFIKDGRRYFVLAENHDRNFWIVSRERLDQPTEGTEVVQPIQRGIIRLAKSNIRKESRLNKPYRIDKKIVFKGVVK